MTSSFGTSPISSLTWIKTILCNHTSLFPLFPGRRGRKLAQNNWNNQRQFPSWDKWQMCSQHSVPLTAISLAEPISSAHGNPKLLLQPRKNPAKQLLGSICSWTFSRIMSVLIKSLGKRDGMNAELCFAFSLEECLFFVSNSRSAKQNQNN